MLLLVSRHITRAVLARASPRVPRLCVTAAVRHASSRAPHAGTEALRFNVFPSDVPAVFQLWCDRNTPFKRAPSINSLKSLFLPFWCFVADVRRGAHGGDTLVHGPTLQVYSGGDYPRVMTEVLKNDVTAAVPFSADMLHLPRSGSGVDVEPFALFESTAWQIARTAHIAHEMEVDPTGGSVAFHDVESHRVLMPCHIVEYSYMTQTFRVFINGVTGRAYGVQQTAVFGSIANLLRYVTVDPKTLGNVVSSLFSPSRSGSQPLGMLLGQGLLLAIRPMLKLLLWPPFAIGAMLAISSYAAVRSTASMRAESATFAAWAETRRSEAAAQATMTDDWVFRPTGRTMFDKRYERRRAREEATHSYTHHEQSAARAAPPPPPPPRSSAQQQAAKPAQGLKRPPYVDPNDYYAVLGLQSVGKAASKEDVQAAFRRELMRYHPDHQAETNLDPAACSERTRLIIAAYGVLRDPNKRKAYDAGRR